MCCAGLVAGFALKMLVAVVVRGVVLVFMVVVMDVVVVVMVVTVPVCR